LLEEFIIELHQSDCVMICLVGNKEGLLGQSTSLNQPTFVFGKSAIKHLNQ